MVKKILIVSILILFFLYPSLIFAQTIDEEIAQISKQIADIEKALAPLKQESSDLKSKISWVKNQIQKTEQSISALEQKIIDKQADIEVQKTLMFQRIRRYYINSQKFTPLLVIFSSRQSSQVLRQYTWYQALISRDKNQIQQFTTDVKSLIDSKNSLKKEKIRLSGLQKNFQDRFGFLAGEIKKAEDYKAELSRRQQELIAAKTAMFNTSVGDVSTSQDPASRADYDPGFRPAFAVFSFGAPHRKGMSQFGAFARSKQGQSAEQILRAYYGDIRLEKIDTAGSIKTTIGTLPFEDNYLVGIAEMPVKWADKGGWEALKAQAIAARTYALAYTNNLAGSICVTEACQVYKSSRFHSPGRWQQAVAETRGVVIKSNQTGNIFSTMYASTAGGAIYSYSSLGHSTPGGWDTTCGSQSCWPQDAYEKISDSPWFYKGWYKTRTNASCGRSHPWLNQQEFADIINAVLYYTKTQDSSHLSQYDSGGCFGGKDPSAWPIEEMARQSQSHGGPVTSISSIGVDYSTAGYTQTVRVSTDKGDFSFSADDFKTVFNLRAPGAIVIKSSLFNIEQK